ncbi:MAG TPA: hypothetical protein VK543_15570 [Puia sp.]|nr:hypothetical protein [Puia sp.]
MLAVINIYQIAVGIISLIVFVGTLKKSLGNDINLNLAFTSLALIALIVYLIYTNVLMLIKKGNFKRLLQINIWVNFAQVFYLSLLGFSYYIFIGIQIMPYFLYKQNINLGVHYELFNVRFSFSYQANEEIAFGLNLIPLILCILLNRILNKHLIETHKESFK